MNALKLKDSRYFDLGFLALGTLFLYFYKLGFGSLASWDEAIYATVAKEVVLSGDWLGLTMNGQLWFDKPPLGIWITALFYKVFGINEFAARLFSSLCGAGTVILTYWVGRTLLGRWPGFVGAAVLLTSSHFIRFSRFGMLDAPLTFFLTLSLYFFWLGRERNRYLIFSGIAIGLAVMTKGFAAFFVFPIIWLYCFLAGEQEVLTRSSYWIGIMVAVAIALPWHLYQSFAHRDQFLSDVVVKHLITRTTRAIEGHAGGYYFYIRTIVNKYHPWILVGIFTAPYFLFRAIKEKEREIIFLTLWMFVIFGIITLVKTKLAWYVLPVYPALSLSVGVFIARLFREHHRVFVSVMFVVVMVLHAYYSHVFVQDYSRDIRGLAPEVIARVPQKSVVYLYNYHEIPAFAFYVGRPVAYADNPETLWNAAKSAPLYCLIHEKDLAPLRGKLAALGVSEKASFEELRLVSQ